MNYLIVDDEPQARKLLQTYMSGLSSYHLIKQCVNPIEAYEALQTSKVDFMFLDIKMPLVSGIDFLRSLQNPPLVIFTTAYNKYAVEGYELDVVDYLLKPISLPRLLKALEKVQGRQLKSTLADRSANTDHIFVKVENKLIKVEVTDILLIEGMQNYVKLHLRDRILIASYTMKAMEDMLSGPRFLRIHRSYIIQTKTILSIEGNVIETSYKNVPIGISYRNLVVQYVTDGR